MEKTQEEEMRMKILTKISEIETELITLREHSAPEALDSAIGRISRMDFINNRSINEARSRKMKLNSKA
ncbi:hypothetical protein [Algoriphagus boritolerans]|uniref:hypothetical protein n=1 Tax=Algoriphagus boritolerans TaxID=308111 RepID=UPI000AEA238C